MAKKKGPRPLGDMEAVDAERYYQLWAGTKGEGPAGSPREAFLAGVQSVVELLDKAKVREGFQLERFKRAFILARQMSTVSAQCVVVLNNIRKRLIVGPDEKPVDTLNIGTTIETVATAIKSAEKVLEVLKVIQPDANGNPVVPPFAAVPPANGTPNG